MMDFEKLGAEIASLVNESVKRATEPLLERIAELEMREWKQQKGDKGDPGRDGRDGLPGVQGEKGLDGINGKDGVDGINGADGKDGIDGLGFDDLDVEYDGERTVTVKFTRGDVVKSFPLRFPIVLDTGVYSESKSYTQGDAVTFAGSYWIARKDATTKPGTSDEWRLAVKRGSPGKDGKDGAKGDKGEKGTNGLNGRDLR